MTNMQLGWRRLVATDTRTGAPVDFTETPSESVVVALWRSHVIRRKTDASGEKLMKAAVQQLLLSVRAYHRVLKLARTIADLAGCEMIQANHVAEAVQYRPRAGI